jgi:AcrR family transcriptional regulator
MVEVVAERGYADTSVELVVARAGVSRRTFYRCYGNREECFQELLDLAWARTLELVAGDFSREPTWQDGVRSALASWLAFLDSEPMLARVCLVESLAAGSWVLEHRERQLTALRALAVARWPKTLAESSSPLAGEGATGSVLGVLQTHIVTGRPGPLIGLLGPLMGLVAAQYLPPDVVTREIERGDALALVRRPVPRRSGIHAGLAIPLVLANPNAHRARRCVLFLAECPCASNREIATAIGVKHDSQMSKLLSCLFMEQLVVRRSAGVGKRNSWSLTSRGERISQVLGVGEIGPSPAWSDNS